MPPKRKGSTRYLVMCPDCKKKIDCRTGNGLYNHLNKYCEESMLNKLKKLKGSSSSSSLVNDMEYECSQSQTNQFSLGAVMDSRGMEIIPVNQENTRVFEEYLNQEIYQDNPDIQPNNFVLPSAMNETNEGGEIQSQLSRVMYGTSLITKQEKEWIFKDAETLNDKLHQQPFFGAFVFQIKLEEKYFKKIEQSTVKIRKRRTKQEMETNKTTEPINATSMALIYSYSIKNGLSRNGVENLLELVDNVTRLEFNKTVNKLHWRSIRSNFDKIHTNIFSPIQRPEFILPPAQYGTRDKQETRPLQPYYGVNFDIVEEISFALMQVENVKDNFVFEYQEMKNEDDVRLYGPFHTAEWFEEIDKHVKDNHGKDAVPLCIGLYSDPTKLTHSMSRQTHPVYLTILNIWGGKSTIFIGYIPHKAYNIDVLEDLLTKNKKININSLKDEIISLLGPSDMMHFYDTILEPLFQYLEGIVFQVGRGESREIRRFFPFLVSLFGDEPIQHERAGTSFLNHLFSCARCLWENCCSFHRPNYDDDDFGVFVKFEYRNVHYESFIRPHLIESIQVEGDDDGKNNNLIKVTNDMQVKENDSWYSVIKFPTKVKVKSVIRTSKNVRSNTIYVENIVSSIIWTKGVNVGKSVVSLNNVQNRTSTLRPHNGYCNFNLTGSWASAVVVGSEGDNIDVLYRDGDREEAVPSSRFIFIDGAPRNADQMDILAEGVLSIMHRRIEHFKTTGKNLTIGDSEDSVENNISRIAALLNVRGRRNLLRKYFPLPSITFHQSLCVGQLHSMKEGIITNAISYVLNLMRAVTYYDQAHYKHNLKTLNERLSRFPESFSSIPCRMVKFQHGLLGIEKEKKRTRKIKFFEPNQLLGHVEGWKRPCLLFKIMFCLGDDNTLLPQATSWLKNILKSNSRQKGGFADVPIFDSTSINLHRMAVNALVSVWEVYMYAQAKALTRTDISTFQQVVRNSRYHMSRLHCILRHLTEEEFEYDRSIKFHNLEHHLSDQYLALGVDPRIDEEIGESAHKEFVHIPFKICSKRREKEKVEMAEHIRRVQLANIIHETHKPSPEDKIDEIEDIHGESFTVQSFIIDFDINNESFNNSSVQLYKSEKSIRKLSDEEMKQNMHPDLSPKKLFDILILHLSKTDLYRTYVEGIIEHKFICKLRTGTKIVRSAPFTIRANPRKIHNSDIRRELQDAYPDFTFVRVKNGNDGSNISQVLAIIEIETRKQQNGQRRTEFNPTFVVVKNLKRCGDKVKSSFPYHQYRYDRSNLSMKVFDVGDIFPACIIPISWKNNEDSEVEPNYEDTGARFLEIESYRLSKTQPTTYEELQKYNDCSHYRFESEEELNGWAHKRDKAHQETLNNKREKRNRDNLTRFSNSNSDELEKRKRVNLGRFKKNKKRKQSKKKSASTIFDENLFDSDSDGDIDDE